MSFPMKQNDTAPKIRSRLRSNGTAVDLSDASAVRFHMRPKGGGTMKIDAAATVVAGDSGLVEYAWQTGDTDATGEFDVEFEVTWTDGTIETFPNDGYGLVTIRDDLD